VSLCPLAAQVGPHKMASNTLLLGDDEAELAG